MERNMSLHKVPMPSQDPQVRIGNFQEVALGYTQEMAMQEAARCLSCRHRPCVEGCPVRIDIPGILVHLRGAQVDAAEGPLGGQRLAMRAAAWAMRAPKRFALAERALRLGRLIAGPDHRITALPWPGSRWTASRDVPEPPPETFRQWWSRTRGGPEGRP